MTQDSYSQGFVSLEHQVLEDLVNQLLLEDLRILDLSEAEVWACLNSPARAATEEAVARTLEQVWNRRRNG